MAIRKCIYVMVLMPLGRHYERSYIRRYKREAKKSSSSARLAGRLSAITSL